MEHIGKAHFPITVPRKEIHDEVQMWFDQGNALLHSYWFFEAERAFRWCIKLDPDCAMAYWALYRCAPVISTTGTLIDVDEDRPKDFLKEASRRKHLVTERERMYIEAWEVRPSAQASVGYSANTLAHPNQLLFKQRLEQILLKYPDDPEAKAVYATENLFSYSLGLDSAVNRYGTELVLQQILAKHPDHPGAHHLRIHNWDGADGWVALDSMDKYGKIAPGVGHALHMPGHGYSGQGMWHEAAISMDSATRVEQQYMGEHKILPFHELWNYAHNRDYLCFFQEQLGMVNAALDGARQLIATPLDPKFNNPTNAGVAYREGLAALRRALIKFERWDEILRPGTIPWVTNLEDRIWQPYVEAVAYLGKGNLAQAENRFAALKSLEPEANNKGNEMFTGHYPFLMLEVAGLLALAKGDDENGIKQLIQAASAEQAFRKNFNDPPYYPRVLFSVLGEVHLKRAEYTQAITAFETALNTLRNDAMALSGLAQSHAALGDRAKATDYYARLLHVWSDADPGLRWMQAAKSLGLNATPKDVSPRQQRRYKSQRLDSFGPARWEPFVAPKLEALDSKRSTVTLEDYRGTNVVVIFYLGKECPHCMAQLREVAKRKDQFARLHTTVLAVSSNPPDQNAASLQTRDLPFRLLSDDASHTNAKRFKSHDDFEELDLHSTVFVDREGRVRWARNGGAPFMELDFLLTEIGRLK